MSQADKHKGFKVGDIGPAGGIVFYDKGVISDGWRYLEVAPTDTSTGIQWWNGKYLSIQTATTIGSGKANTAAIIAAQGPGKYAAQLCQDLVSGGFDDWFLPSADELDLIYENLKKAGLGGFGALWYWSSSQYNNYSAWVQYVNCGNRYSNAANFSYSVRAVRAFAALKTDAHGNEIHGQPEAVLTAEGSRLAEESAAYVPPPPLWTGMSTPPAFTPSDSIGLGDQYDDSLSSAVDAIEKRLERNADTLQKMESRMLSNQADYEALTDSQRRITARLDGLDTQWGASEERITALEHDLEASALDNSRWELYKAAVQGFAAGGGNTGEMAVEAMKLADAALAEWQKREGECATFKDALADIQEQASELAEARGLLRKVCQHGAGADQWTAAMQYLAAHPDGEKEKKHD